MTVATWNVQRLGKHKVEHNVLKEYKFNIAVIIENLKGPKGLLDYVMPYSDVSNTNGVYCGVAVLINRNEKNRMEISERHNHELQRDLSRTNKSEYVVILVKRVLG